MGMPQPDAPRPLAWDAERPGLHPHAERGDDHLKHLSTSLVCFTC
ncbi:hypothetical protein EMIT0P395_20260 [Pseudomonas sp. IT-P395]